MTVRLAVAGAFHTSYMAPAAEKLQEALASTSIVAPEIPVISNVDAMPHSDPEVIKSILTQQVLQRDIIPSEQSTAWSTSTASAVHVCLWLC